MRMHYATHPPYRGKVLKRAKRAGKTFPCFIEIRLDPVLGLEMQSLYPRALSVYRGTDNNGVLIKHCYDYYEYRDCLTLNQAWDSLTQQKKDENVFDIG